MRCSSQQSEEQIKTIPPEKGNVIEIENKVGNLLTNNDINFTNKENSPKRHEIEKNKKKMGIY